MKNLIYILVFTCAVLSVSAQSVSDKKVGGPCDGCELMFEGMPSLTDLQSATSLTDKNEPGEPMIISGTIFKKDGKTPAPGIILYVYHTDSKGIYSKVPNQKYGLRHGHIRGWMKTDSKGHYEFKSIRPAPYPNANNPAHVHPTIKEPGLSLYYLDEYLFEDDALVTTEVRSRQEKRGGSGIIALTKNQNGVWIGHRDIILGLNIPGY